MSDVQSTTDADQSMPDEVFLGGGEWIGKIFHFYLFGAVVCTGVLIVVFGVGWTLIPVGILFATAIWLLVKAVLHPIRIKLVLTKDRLVDLRENHEIPFAAVQAITHYVVNGSLHGLNVEWQDGRHSRESYVSLVFFTVDPQEIADKIQSRYETVRTFRSLVSEVVANRRSGITEDQLVSKLQNRGVSGELLARVLSQSADIVPDSMAALSIPDDCFIEDDSDLDSVAETAVSQARPITVEADTHKSTDQQPVFPEPTRSLLWLRQQDTLEFFSPVNFARQSFWGCVVLLGVSLYYLTYACINGIKAEPSPWVIVGGLILPGVCSYVLAGLINRPLERVANRIVPYVKISPTEVAYNYFCSWTIPFDSIIDISADQRNTKSVNSLLITHVDQRTGRRRQKRFIVNLPIEHTSNRLNYWDAKQSVYATLQKRWRMRQDHKQTLQGVREDLQVGIGQDAIIRKLRYMGWSLEHAEEFYRNASTTTD
jgi:hypothetical protein